MQERLAGVLRHDGERVVDLNVEVVEDRVEVFAFRAHSQTARVANRVRTGLTISKYVSLNDDAIAKLVSLVCVWASVSHLNGDGRFPAINSQMLYMYMQ